MQSRDKYNPFRARYERLGKRPKDSTGDPYNLKYRLGKGTVTGEETLLLPFQFAYRDHRTFTH